MILVKLNNPQGDIFGGSTAAPVTKIINQAALAAHDAALDRRKLAMRDPRDSLTPIADSSAHAPVVTEDDTLPSVVLSLAAAHRAPAPVTTPRPIPDVRG